MRIATRPALVGAIASTVLLLGATGATADATRGDPAGARPTSAQAADPCANGTGGQECFPAVGDDGWTLELQELLAPVAAQVHEALDEDPKLGDVSLDFVDRAVVVRYAGRPPHVLHRIAANARRTGVALRTEVVAYGLEELLTKAMGVANALNDAHVPWTEVAPSADLAGLTVALPPGALPSTADGNRAGIARATDEPDAVGETGEQALAAAASVVGSLPVTLATQEPAVTLVNDRQGDTPPFSGGSRISLADSPDLQCTSGFSLQGLGTNYLLTAAHCAKYQNGKTFTTGNNYWASLGGSNLTLGKNSWTKLLYWDPVDALDATLIDVGPQRGFPAVFGGGWNSTQADRLAVRTYYAWDYRMRGCLSGSMSGTRCNLARVDGHEAGVVQPPGAPRPAVVFWVRDRDAQTNIHAGAEGDSGGPLFWVDSAGQRQALGILSMGRTFIPCTAPGVAPDHGACFAELGVTPINRVMSALAPWGITIDTQ